MINLRLKADFSKQNPAFVVKVVSSAPPDEDPSKFAISVTRGRGTHSLSSPYGDISLHVEETDSVEGDVLLCVPKRGIAQRLFRRSSRHNTILLTERCDQLCVMCSQPPKNSNDAWLFPHFERALHLVDANVQIGVTGGEPTLYKDELLGMIERVGQDRADISYHILSNGQHFEPEDRGRLSRLHRQTNITWGVPLYSHKEKVHDEIVGKDGAYNRVLENLFLLASTKAKIELRTVITAKNVFDLPNLAKFVASHLPFVSDWAVMGMEPVGYAKANRQQLFFDHSVFPQPLVNAARISDLRGRPCHFYNIPRCTVPKGIRGHCVDSISDWKKKFLPECEGCSEISICSGFFEWYNHEWKWSGVQAITDRESKL